MLNIRFCRPESRTVKHNFISAKFVSSLRMALLEAQIIIYVEGRDSSVCIVAHKVVINAAS
jgi:hypothetical protein